MNRVRGYIFSRPFMGERVPQHVQNLVIRDYCARRQLQFLLSATEYAMPGCDLILAQVLDALPEVDGIVAGDVTWGHRIVAYSLFQLPEGWQGRSRVFQRLLDQGKALHCAVEDLKAGNAQEFDRLETLWQVRQTLPDCLQSVA